MIIGVTGLIGSGKSKFGELISNYYKIDVLDCDYEVQYIYETDLNVVQQIEDIVGKCRGSNGTFDKRILGKKLFGSPHMVDAINQIVHPVVKGRVIENIIRAKQDKNHLVVLVPLLFESHWEHLFDKTLYIYTDYNIRVDRLSDPQLRNMPVNIIDFYDGLQIPPHKKFIMADHVILNNSLELLKKSMYEIFIKLF